MDGDTKPGGVVVSAKKRFRPFRRMARPGPSTSSPLKKIFVVVVVIAIAVLSYAFLYRKTTEKSALIIGDSELSQAKYDSLLVQAKRKLVNEEGAKNTILDAYKYKEAAKKLGITFTQKDLEAIDKYSALPNTVKDDFYYLGLQRSYVDLQLKLREQDGYEGYVFYYPFSRHFLDSDPTNAGDQYKDQSAILKDKQAAQAKADSARKRLQSGTAKPEKLVEEILNDRSLIYGNASNDTQHFVVNKSGYALLGGSGAKNVAARFIELLPKMKDGEISKIMDDVQTYTDEQTQQRVTSNTAYYFVYKMKNIVGNTNIASNFKAAVDQVKVVDNVKK